MLSYSRGPDAPLLEQTIPQYLDSIAARWPDREALIVRHQNARLNWRDLLRESNRVAAGLVALGLQPGDRVGLWASNCVEWVLLQYACARARLVLVNVNPAYRSHDLAYILRKSQMRALVLRESDERANYRAILEEATAGQKLLLQHVLCLGQESWDRMLEGGGELPPMPHNPHEVFNIQYTSGTTGSPKGVLLTHHNLLNNAAVLANWLNYSERDRCVLPLPLYHCAGCVCGVLACLTRGTAIILPSAQFDAGAALEAVAAEGATFLAGVPTMWIAMLEHPRRVQRDLSSLRKGFIGGSPCPLELMKRILSEMHCPELTVIYGQTEASPLISMAAPDDPTEMRISTIGRACPNSEIKIVSPGGETVPVGEQGELCTRGYMVMKGYDGEPEATARTIDADGWLHTGDLGVMLPSGHLHITGRAKEMIIRGGENIFPREIEEFLFTHPSVAEVAVVGLPDPRLGETVLAWVRPKPGQTVAEEELRGWCEGRIAHFKIPQHFRFVDAFPMTVTGKIQKFRIREIEIEERGLAAVAVARTA